MSVGEASGREVDAVPRDRYEGRMGATHLHGGTSHAGGAETLTDSVAVDAGVRRGRTHHCLAGDTRIATPRGPVAMSEIRAGAEIYTLDPALGMRVARVARHEPAGVRAVLRIETAGRCLRATATQLVATIVGRGKRGGALRATPAGELGDDAVLVCAEGYYAQDGAQSDALARAMGAFLAMGYVENGRVGATVGEWSEPHVQQYAALFESVFAHAGWEHGEGIAGGISCASLAVAEQLEQLGLARAMEQRAVPQWAFSVSREAKLALLAGYMDAAGRMARDSKKALTGAGQIHAQFCPRLVAELRELAIGAALDISAVQYERPKDSSLRVRSFALLSASGMAALPCWDPHKRASAAPAPARLTAEKLGGVVLPVGAFAQKIKSIEQEEAVEVFALEVEDATADVTSFVADGVVVHH